MKKIRTVLSLLRFNARSLILFELFYKLVSAAAIPLFKLCFTGVMHATGHRYITGDNLSAFLKHPMTIVFLIVLLFILTIWSMIDIQTVIVILDCSRRKEKTTIAPALRHALKNSPRIFLPGNLLLVLNVLLLIPFLNIGLSTGLAGSVSIPEFIMNVIRKKPLYHVLFFAVLVLIIFFAVRWIYAFHFFTLEGCSFRHAQKKSIALGKKKHLRNLLTLLLLQAALFALFAAAALAGILVILLLWKLLGAKAAFSILTSVIVVFLGILAVAVMALSMPAGYAVISAMYYDHLEAAGAEPASPALEASAPKKMRPAARACLAVILAAAVTACAVYTYGVSRGKYSLQIEHAITTQVTAHRGASSSYPENTMAAFRGAYEQGADWIELDVQQSADGVIFIMHDTNFLRTCGVNKNTWEVPWDEIRTYDAGKRFSKKFAGEPVPLLSDAIDYAKLAGIRLNIELKPTGHETDFEKSVVDIVREANFEGDCIITSQNYSVLERVKAYDEEIRTAYVMNVALGRIEELSAADDFSLKETFVTAALVKRMHNLGKTVLVWTVNTSRNMDKMIDLGVDNVITDRVVLAKERVNESRTSSAVWMILEKLMKLFNIRH